MESCVWVCDGLLLTQRVFGLPLLWAMHCPQDLSQDCVGSQVSFVPFVQTSLFSLI